MEGSSLSMKRIHKFITEDEINDYKSLTNDEIKNGILNFGSGFCFGILGLDYEFDSISDDFWKEEKENINFRKMFGVPEGDLDILLEQFREEGFTKYCRAGIWRHSFTKILSNNGNIEEYNTYTTFFRYLNKWNQESDLDDYKIIVDYNKKIMWIGCDSFNDEDHYISDGKNIYVFSYAGKGISLSKKVFTTDEYFSDDNDDLNDQLIEKYRLGRIIGRESFPFSIEEYFDKRFFYRGIKHTRYYKFMHSSDRDTTILNSIQVKNNLFYFEIENITYPHYGYILFDINGMRIVEAGRLVT